MAVVHAVDGQSKYIFVTVMLYYLVNYHHWILTIKTNVFCSAMIKIRT